MKCEVLVDWFTFSVKVNNPNEVIRDWLGMDPNLFEDRSYGINGYLQSKCFSSIIVCYNGYNNDFFSRDDMGVCVSMSGDGCRTFERFSSLGFNGLFRKLYENMVDVREDSGDVAELLKKSADCCCNISRIDVACDDKARDDASGQLDMDVIVDKAVFHHDFNSRMKKGTLFLGKDGDNWDGRSVYIGSKSSVFRMRIYDKALEQKEKGIWKESVKDHWVRVEMVMRDENARGFVAQAVQAESIGKLAAQVLNDKFKFIERDNKNISRCSVCDWWAAFVEEVEAVVIWSRSAIQHSVHRIDHWLRWQISSSMAVIVATLGYGWLRDIVVHGQGRLSPRQEALIRDFHAQKAATLAKYPFLAETAVSGV